MAAVAHPDRRRTAVRPERTDRLLSLGAAILFAAAVAAIVRGHAQWRMVPPLIWLHLLTILVATALTPVMLLRVRGDRRHRTTGKVWMAAMLATAITSLFIHVSGPGQFSVIHLLSLWPCRAWHGDRRVTRSRLLHLPVPSAARYLAISLICAG
jgi:uncharacterized membrane protein